VDFPQLNGKSNEYADFDDKIGFIVENVEQDDEWLKDVEENRSHGQTLKWFAVSPELDICLSHANNNAGDLISELITMAQMLSDTLYLQCKVLSNALY